MMSHSFFVSADSNFFHVGFPDRCPSSTRFKGPRFTSIASASLVIVIPFLSRKSRMNSSYSQCRTISNPRLQAANGDSPTVTFQVQTTNL